MKTDQFTILTLSFSVFGFFDEQVCTMSLHFSSKFTSALDFTSRITETTSATQAVASCKREEKASVEPIVTAIIVTGPAAAAQA